MGKLKIVLDTNVVVSAVLTKGSPAKVLHLWNAGIFEVIISNEIIQEYYSVLSREKFCLSPSIVKTIIDEFIREAIIVNKKSLINAVKKDPCDNKFIETAVDGGADFIISGDKHLLDIKRYNDVEILSINEFLNKL